MSITENSQVVTGHATGSLQSIPCSFPNCDCAEPKLHIGARAIAVRIFGEASQDRAVFRTKGLPIQRRGGRLVLRECVAKAFIEGRLKSGQR